MKQEETISAIATAVGTAGVGIIRMSGETAIEIADEIFVASNNSPISNASDRSVIFGHVVDAVGEIIDEALVLVMRSPKSYTKEDVIEIQCHGGIASVRAVLARTFEAGARPAERGEFTKRAFLNGRLDLSQTQAVLDIIQAKTSTALNVAQKQLSGKTSNKIRDIRSEILEIVAHIEALIDFPEEDINDVVIDEIDNKLSVQIDNIRKLLDNQHSGRILREGLVTAIIGKPNVGKSSLLNYLAETDRAIVTNIPGTTRDSIEEFINVDGIPFKIVDTAGIRESNNPVEQIGIERARECVEKAELILALFDSSQPLTDEDFNILNLINSKNVIVLLTKSDLPQIIDKSTIRQYSNSEIISISVKNNSGICELFNVITDKVGDIDTEMDFVRDEREANLLRRTIQNLESSQHTLKNNIGIDFISIDLRDALENLSELTGESASEDVINEIFSKFCIGK